MLSDLVKDIFCGKNLLCCELKSIGTNKFDQNDYNEFLNKLCFSIRLFNYIYTISNIFMKIILKLLNS
jgi:hypothetical protein